MLKQAALYVQIYFCHKYVTDIVYYLWNWDVLLFDLIKLIVYNWTEQQQQKKTKDKKFAISSLFKYHVSLYVLELFTYAFRQTKMSSCGPFLAGILEAT